MDIERFVDENFVINQENQVEMAFLGLESDYEVRPKFAHSKIQLELDFVKQAVPGERKSNKKLGAVDI